MATADKTSDIRAARAPGRYPYNGRMVLVSVPDGAVSAQVLIVLFVTLIASSATFWLLSRRLTSHRQWVALGEWARDAGFRMNPCGPDQLPRPLEVLQAARPRIRVCLARQKLTLLQMQTQDPHSPPGLAPSSEAIPWNVLLKECDWEWPPTGLRPSALSRSLLDLFSLSSFPMLGNTERFVLFGTESESAGMLWRSMAPSLLPPDVGLLLHGRHLLLDFSSRPFDELELDRMLALAGQLVQKLPAPSRA